MPKLIARSLAADRPAGPLPVTRRAAAGLAAGICVALLAGCGDPAKWHSIDVSGSLPPLEFTMTRTGDGKEVTQANYRGKIVLVYFGYTNCPDQCPTTMSNAAQILARLGAQARRVRVLFVTVDPHRDTPAVLAAYVRNFAPQIEGLRGTPDQLAALARRYRVVYSVSSATDGRPYEVTHSAATYVFDGSGAARLMIASLDTPSPDLGGATADLQRLLGEAQPRGFLARLWRRL